MSETEMEDLATEKIVDANEGNHALAAGPQSALVPENPAGRIRHGMVLVLKGWCHLEDQEGQPGGRYPVFATAETAERWDDFIDDRSYGVVLSTQDARPASVEGFWTIRIAPVRKPETVLVSDHGTEGVANLRPGELLVRHAQSSAVNPFAEPLLGSDTLYVVASIPDGPWTGTREVVAHRAPKALSKDLVDALFVRAPVFPRVGAPVRDDLPFRTGLLWASSMNYSLSPGMRLTWVENVKVTGVEYGLYRRAEPGEDSPYVVVGETGPLGADARYHRVEVQHSPSTGEELEAREKELVDLGGFLDGLGLGTDEDEDEQKGEVIDDDDDVEEEIRSACGEPKTVENSEEEPASEPTKPVIDGCVRLLEVAATPEVPSRLVQVEAAKLLAHDVEHGHGIELLAATQAALRLLAFEDLDARALGYLTGALADRGERPEVARKLARSQKPERRVAAAFLLPEEERTFLVHDEDDQVRRAAKWAADPDRGRTAWRTKTNNYAEAVRSTIQLAALGDGLVDEAIDVLSSLWDLDSGTQYDKKTRQRWAAAVDKAIEALEIDGNARSLEPTDWEEASNPVASDKDLEDLWIPPAQREAMAKVIKEHCPGTTPARPASKGPDQGTVDGETFVGNEPAGGTYRRFELHQAKVGHPSDKPAKAQLVGSHGAHREVGKPDQDAADPSDVQDYKDLERLWDASDVQVKSDPSASANVVKKLRATSRTPNRAEYLGHRPNMQKIAREMFPVAELPMPVKPVYDMDSDLADRIVEDVATVLAAKGLRGETQFAGSIDEAAGFAGEANGIGHPDPGEHAHTVVLPPCDVCDEILDADWYKNANFRPMGWRGHGHAAELVGGQLCNVGECAHKIFLQSPRSCSTCGKFITGARQLEAIGNAMFINQARIRSKTTWGRKAHKEVREEKYEERQEAAEQGNLGALGWSARETVLLDVSGGVRGGVAKHTLLIRRDWRREDGVVLPVCEVATSRDLPPENLEDLWVATRQPVKGARWPLYYARAFNVADRPGGEPSILDALDRSVLRDGLDWAEQFVGMGIYVLEKDLEQRLSDPERWPQDDLAARDKVLRAMSKAHREIVAGLPIGSAIGPLTALAASWHNTTADVVAVDPQMTFEENQLLRLIPNGWQKLGDYRSVQRADLAVPFDFQREFRAGEFRVATGDGLTARIGGQVVYLARVHAEGPLSPLELGERLRKSRVQHLIELRRAGVVVWEDPPTPDPEAEGPAGPVTPGPLSSLEVEAMEQVYGSGIGPRAVSEQEVEAMEAVFALADLPAQTMPEFLRQLDQDRAGSAPVLMRQEDFEDLKRFDTGTGEATEPEKS